MKVQSAVRTSKRRRCRVCWQVRKRRTIGRTMPNSPRSPSSFFINFSAFTSEPISMREPWANPGRSNATQDRAASAGLKCAETYVHGLTQYCLRIRLAEGEKAYPNVRARSDGEKTASGLRAGIRQTRIPRRPELSYCSVRVFISNAVRYLAYAAVLR